MFCKTYHYLFLYLQLFLQTDFFRLNEISVEDVHVDPQSDPDDDEMDVFKSVFYLHLVLFFSSPWMQFGVLTAI